MGGEPLSFDVALTGQEDLIKLLIRGGAAGDEVLGEAVYQGGQLAFRVV